MPRKKAEKSVSRIASEIADLNNRILLECPTAASDKWLPPDLQNRKALGEEITPPSESYLTHFQFKDLPLSNRTRRGLQNAKFRFLTRIQREAIPHALAGRSVLGDAETGSGKTLAFLIPLLENLFRAGWAKENGLGAMIIAPTCELSTQIFTVLSKVGKYHDFSACCLVGGRDADKEAAVLPVSNIVVGTPGRLLHHLDETPMWDVSHLRMFVIDEADQLVERGFVDTIKAILEQLPPADSRQNLFFSATLSSLEAECLARLAVPGSAARVNARKSTGKHSSGLTPASLKAFYAMVDLHEQLNVLFGFLRANSQQRIVVFVNTVKQVRFLYEALHRLKPGPAMFELHGKQALQKKQQILRSFCAKQHAACLLATDVVARGIDFPDLNWVVQLDCPLDVDSYIHRAGRTARLEKEGKSLLFLVPSEKAFLCRLEEKRLPIKKVKVASKVGDVSKTLAAILAKEPELRHLAQRSFVSYLRSVATAADREIFNVKQMLGMESGTEMKTEAADKFARSLGLAGAPLLSELGLTAQGDLLHQSAKKKSKEEIIKETITARKATVKAKMEEASKLGLEISEGENDWDEALREHKKAHLSRKQKRAERMRLMREGKELPEGFGIKSGTLGSMGAALGFHEDDDDEEFLQPSHKERHFEGTMGVLDMQSPAVQKRIRKQQIRFRSDGTAKIRGLAQLDQAKKRGEGHVFFSDDENGNVKTKNLNEAVLDEIKSEAPPLKGKSAEIDRQQALRAELKITDAADRTAEKTLLKERRRKRKAFLEGESVKRSRNE